MKKQTKAKKRNPQDATLRNIRALQKRVSKLEYLVKGLSALVGRAIEQLCEEPK